MSMRGWTQADVDAYLARQSANAPKNAHTASGDVSGMDARAGRRNAAQAILGTMTGQTKKQTEGRSK